jgi:hypothetical protein
MTKEDLIDDIIVKYIANVRELTEDGRERYSLTKLITYAQLAEDLIRQLDRAGRDTSGSVCEGYAEKWYLRDFDLIPEQVKRYPFVVCRQCLEEAEAAGLLFDTREEADAAREAMLQRKASSVSPIQL